MGCTGSKSGDSENKPAGSIEPAKQDKNQEPAKSGIADADATSKNLKDFYDLGKELGSGAFSVVFEGKNKKTGESVAIKRIRKKSIDADVIVTLRREITNLRRVSHPNILKLFEVYEDDNELYLVMELVRGKELFDKIVEKGQYSEKDAANIVRQIVSAIEYLHSMGIAHRDLKPENLLSAGEGDQEVVKVVDFGLSKDFGDEKLQTSCGSPTYVAPEVLSSDTYDKACDLWSLGVITYILLCGYPPFYGETNPQLYKQIMAVKYDFDDESWESISEEAKDFIRHLLVKDTQERYTAKQCLEHSWLKPSHHHTGNIKTRNLRKFQSKAKGLGEELAEGNE